MLPAKSSVDALALLGNSHSRTFSDSLDASNYGGIATSDAVAGLAYYFSGHDYLDVPGLDVSPRAFPELTIGAWVKVNGLIMRSRYFCYRRCCRGCCCCESTETAARNALRLEMRS